MKTISLPKILTWLQFLDFPHKLGVCERLFGRMISSNGICWVDTGAGIPWKLDLANPTHRWIVYGKYEGAHFINWAQEFLPNDGIVIDSGANIGQMLMYLAQYIPQGKVLAFEPGNEAANWLEECLDVNPTLPVEVIRAGLGSSEANLRLKQIGVNYGHGAWNQISETEGEVIKIVRLVDELSSRSITKIDLWVLDIEGYELLALKGAEYLLKQQQIKAIYVEMFGKNGQEIRKYLESFGYKCRIFNSKDDLYSPSEFPEFTNGLFLPS